MEPGDCFKSGGPGDLEEGSRESILVRAGTRHRDTHILSLWGGEFSGLRVLCLAYGGYAW